MTSAAGAKGASNAASLLAAEDVRTISELGFMACNAGHHKAAHAIFQGLRLLRPDRTFPFIGLAMMNMSAGRPEDAARLLREEALAAHPGDGELMLFLALALRSAGRAAESAKVLDKLLASTSAEPPVRALATRLATEPGALVTKMLGGGKQPARSAGPLSGWSAAPRPR